MPGYSPCVLEVLALFLAATWPVLAFSAIAVGTVWWAIFGDKARGRRRCPRCWHDLSRTPGLTCGECGFAARAEAQLARPRRRWWLAAVALLATASVAVAAQLSILSASWPTYLPAAVLVRMPRAAATVPVPRAAERELGRRVARGELDAGELLELVRSVAGSGVPVGGREEPLARVLAEASSATPAEFLPVDGEPASSSADRHAALAAWRDAVAAELAALPPWVDVATPVHLPEGCAVPAMVRATVWGDAEWRIRARDDGPWLVGDGLAGLSSQPRGGPVELAAALPGGRIAAKLRMQVRRRGAPSAGWGPWADVAPIDVDRTVTPLAADAMPASASPALDDAVRRAFDWPLTVWDRGARVTAFHFSLGSLRDPGGDANADVAFGACIELLEDGAPRRRLRAWCTGRDERSAGWITEHEDEAGLARLRTLVAGLPADADPATVPGWTVRVRSDREAALRCLATLRVGAPPARRWQGEMEWPVRAVRSPAEGPPRSYRLRFPD